MKDERIISEVQKLSMHGFMIVLAGIMVSVFIKVFILQWDFKYWLDIFLILMVACLYVTVRGIKSGVYLFPSKDGNVKRFKKINLISGAIGTMVWATLMFISDLMESGNLDVAKSMLSILVGSIIFFFGIIWFQWFIIKRSNHNADKKLDK